MWWVTLFSTDNVEHTVNIAAVVQVISQSDGIRQVHLIGGETLLITAQEWTTKMHLQIQRTPAASAKAEAVGKIAIPTHLKEK